MRGFRRPAVIPYLGQLGVVRVTYARVSERSQIANHKSSAFSRTEGISALKRAKANWCSLKPALAQNVRIGRTPVPGPAQPRWLFPWAKSAASSNSPFLAPSRKHAHSFRSKTSTRPSGSPVTRISTQSPRDHRALSGNATSIEPSV